MGTYKNQNIYDAVFLFYQIISYLVTINFTNIINIIFVNKRSHVLSKFVITLLSPKNRVALSESIDEVKLLPKFKHNVFEG